MQFTPQQLVGGSRYSQGKLGNWSEDLELDSLKLQDYLTRKDQGELLVNAKQQKLEVALNPAALTGDTRELKFGSTVMLANHKSEAFLSVNPFEKRPGTCACSVTTSRNAVPCVRNTFIIERESKNDGFGDSDVVHFGQDFRLAVLPFAGLPANNYLMSEHVTPLSCSKFSRKQEVTIVPETHGKTLWHFTWADVKQRFEQQANPVLIDHPICLRHVHTGSFLASCNTINQQNLFGNEYECHCDVYKSLNKTQNLFSESKGQITGDYPLRRQGIQNLWTVVSGWVAGEGGGESPGAGA